MLIPLKLCNGRFWEYERTDSPPPLLGHEMRQLAAGWEWARRLKVLVSTVYRRRKELQVKELSCEPVGFSVLGINIAAAISQTCRGTASDECFCDIVYNHPLEAFAGHIRRTPRDKIGNRVVMKIFKSFPHNIRFATDDYATKILYIEQDGVVAGVFLYGDEVDSEDSQFSWDELKKEDLDVDPASASTDSEEQNSDE